MFRRQDSWAAHNHLDTARWFSRTNELRPPLTWAGVTDLGDVAYVGEFVNRNGKITT